jgi:hypothetical protein
MLYYFLGSRLPALEIGQQPEITWEEFLFLIENNLTKSDLHWVNTLRFYDDLDNMRRFWIGEEPNPRGTFNVVDLEAALLNSATLPSYVSAYLEQYSQREERVRHFPALIAAYFRQDVSKAPAFIRDFLQFERQLRLVLTGMRAKALGRDLATELANEDPDDPLVIQLMAQKDSKGFEPPEGFEELKVIFQQHGSDALDLYQALVAYRFHWIDERLTAEMFSIDRILGYTMQFLLILQWLELDQKKGLGLIENMIKGAL